MHLNDRQGPAIALPRQRFTNGFFALTLLAVACSSTETTSTMTGVWAGRAAYITPNDSFAFSFKQDGAEVEGWGVIYSGADEHPITRLGGGGVVAGRELTMALIDFDQNSSIVPGAFYNLTVPSGRVQTNAVLEAGPQSYPITLRLTRPPSDLAGTWALTSTTGEVAPAGLLDTILVNADGRANRHREGDTFYSTRAMWSRRGNYMLIDNEIGPFRDSLFIQSTELQHTVVTATGTRAEHYTRVSTSANLP
jgi:hypothetical protein